MAYRIDVFKFDGPSIDSDGFLSAEANFTRTGVFPYLMWDGTVSYELRHPDDVFSKDSLESCQSLVLTNDHPPMMLGSWNAKEYQCGFTGETITIKDNKFIAGKIKVTDEKCVGDVMQGGKNQISMGYVCDVVQEAGVFEGQQYTARQKNIRYNHASIVWEGRAGPEVSIKTDSAMKDLGVMRLDSEKKTCIKKDEQVQSNQELEKNGDKKMKFKIDSVEFEAEETLAKSVQNKIDSLSESVSKAEAKADTLAKQIQERDAEIQKIKNDLSDDATLARAESLLKIKEFAKEVLGEEKSDTIENLKKSVCEKLGVDCSKKDSIYLDVAFETLMRTHKPAEKKDALAEHIEENAGKKQDSVDDKIKAHMDNLANRWKVKKGLAAK